MHLNTMNPPFILDHKLKRTLFIVGIMALLFRIIFISDMLRHKSSEEIESMTPDSIGYVHLAKNIAHDHVYAQPTLESRQFALRRTPGYPFFYAIFEYLGAAPQGVLIAQAVIGVCIPLFVSLLVYLILQSSTVSLFAGLFSAVSPAGIGLSGVILVDHLFACIFITGFFLMYTGITYARTGYMYWSGTVFGVGTLIKPILVLWPAYSLVICYLFAKASRQRIQWKALSICVLIQILFVGGLCTRNYVAEGMFTPSAIGIEALRYMVAPKVEVFAETDNFNFRDKTIFNKIMHNNKSVYKRNHEAVNNGTPFAALYKQQRDESIAIFKANPLTTIKVYLIHMRENTTRKFEYFSIQLPRQSQIYRYLSIHNYLTHRSENIVHFTIVIYLISLLIPYGKYSGEILTPIFYISCSFFLTFFYFQFLSGTTHWSGPRVLYPAEFCLAILFTFALYTLVEKTGLIKRGQPHSAAKTISDPDIKH